MHAHKGPLPASTRLMADAQRGPLSGWAEPLLKVVSTQSALGIYSFAHANSNTVVCLQQTTDTFFYGGANRWACAVLGDIAFAMYAASWPASGHGDGGRRKPHSTQKLQLKASSKRPLCFACKCCTRCHCAWNGTRTSQFSGTAEAHFYLQCTGSFRSSRTAPCIGGALMCCA
jgi:hypothetical protein